MPEIQWCITETWYRHGNTPPPHTHTHTHAHKETHVPDSRLHNCQITKALVACTAYTCTVDSTGVCSQLTNGWGVVKETVWWWRQWALSRLQQQSNKTQNLKRKHWPTCLEDLHLFRKKTSINLSIMIYSAHAIYWSRTHNTSTYSNTLDKNELSWMKNKFDHRISCSITSNQRRAKGCVQNRSLCPDRAGHSIMIEHDILIDITWSNRILHLWSFLFVCSG